MNTIYKKTREIYIIGVIFSFCLFELKFLLDNAELGSFQEIIIVLAGLLQIIIYARFSIIKKEFDNRYILEKSVALYAITVVLINRYLVYTKVGVVIIEGLFFLLLLFAVYNISKKSLYIEMVNRCLIVTIILSICLKFYIYKFYRIDFEQRTERMFWVCFLYLCLWIISCASWNFMLYTHKIEKLYLMLSLLMGVVFLVIFPPMSAPDEECHFAMAYSFSNEFLGGERTIQEVGLRENGNSCMFYQIPARETDAECIQRVYDFEYVWQYPGYEDYNQIVSEISKLPADGEQFGSYFIGRFTNGSFLAYLPAILGITISRIIGLGGMQLIFIGRLFNYLFFVGMIYLAIKKIPIGKRILMVTALFPITLELGASYSYDSILIASTYYFIASILYLYYKENKIGAKDIIPLIVSMLFVSSAKVVYSFVGLLTLLLPCGKYKKPIYKWAVFLGVFFVAILISLWGSSSGISNYVQTDDTAYYTLTYMINHIDEVIFLILNSIIVNNEYYMGTLGGELLGWLDFKISFVVVGITFGICYLSTLRKNNAEKINCNVGIIFTGVFVFIVMLLFVTTVMWTPIGNQVVEGFQGRYLLEIIPMPLIASLALKRNTCIKKDNRNVLAIGMLGVNLVSALTVFNIIMMR